MRVYFFSNPKKNTGSVLLLHASQNFATPQNNLTPSPKREFELRYYQGNFFSLGKLKNGNCGER